MADPTTSFFNEYDLADDQHQKAILVRTGGYQLVIKGISHGDFSDWPFFSVRRRLLGHPSDNTVLVRLLGAYTVAFFNTVLNGSPPGPPLVGPAPDPRATLRVFR